MANGTAYSELSYIPSTTLTVLLVEDNADYAAMVMRWLSGAKHQTEFAVNWADSLATALARLEEGGVDVVLLDLGLPDSDGLGTFLAVSHSVVNQASDLPVIILSARDSEAMALQTIQQGAQDYFVKSTCTAEQLMRTLRHTTIRRHSLKRGALPEAQPALSTVVGVLSGSGGAGVTTTACVLAAELRRQTDEATLLMDTDLSPGLIGFMMGVSSPRSVWDSAGFAHRIDAAAWTELVAPGAGNLDILATSITMEKGNLSIENLRRVVDYARANYKWIVVDLGRLNQISRQTLAWADEVVLVAAPSIPALHQCRQTIDMFEDLGVKRDKVRLILNQRESPRHLSGKQIQKLFGIPISGILPPAHDDLYHACLEKRLPNESDPFRVELAAMARKMAGLPEEQSRRSLLSLTSIAGKMRGRG